MRSFRRVTQRVAPAAASVASVLLFATCDFDKISGTPKEITAQDVARLFSITPAADTVVTLGGTATLSVTPASGVSLENATTVWSSNNSFATVNASTGVVTGAAIGSSLITARLISPELDTGYVRTRAMRVRYKGIKLSAIDSITGKGAGPQRAINVQGTNAADQLQTPAITVNATLSAHDSGSTNSNVLQINGTNVQGKTNGIAYVIAAFDNFKDSVKVKMRQVAKSLTFPTQDYTATALNLNRPQVPMTIKDVGDSIMTSSPVLRFRSSDTTVFTVDSLTGVMRFKKVDTARIYVRVDTLNVGLNQIAKSQKVLVSQQVAFVNKFAGDNQTDTVAQTLPIAPTVTVLDSGSTPIVGASVMFRKVRGLNATITDSVKLTDVNGRATLGAWKVGDVALTSGDTVSATAGGITAFFRATTVAGPPRKLAFAVQPTSSASSAAFSPEVKVSIVDSLGNIVTTATDSVFIAIANNPGGSPLGGTTRTAAVAGVATFTALEVDAGFGQGYTLEASANGLQSVISNGFDVFGDKTKLAFTTQPTTTTATATMATVRVAIQDAQGITVSSATDSVALTLQNAVTATLGGTVKVKAVGGVATFNNLMVSGPGSGFALQATTPNTAPALTSATSNTFTVNSVGAAAKLEFQQQPSTVIAGQVIAPNITVRVLDANGALVVSSAQQVTLSIESTSPTGATLGGTVARTAQNGVATFTDITLNKSGNGYKLLATATGSSSITAATSASFNVNTGAANKLGFVVQPTHTPFGTAILPAVVVEIQDAAGNRVTSGNAFSVSLALGGCTLASLSGGGATNSVNGIATFGGLTISSQQAASCTLAASASGLQSATSQFFSSIASNGAARLRFTVQPAASTGAGTSMNAGTVAVQDVNGNSVTASSSVFISLSVIGPGFINSGTSSGSTTTTLSFPSLTFNTAGTYRLVASATGFDPDTSAQFTINPGSINRVNFITQPTTIVAGAPFSPIVQVAVADANNNTVTSATNLVTLTISGGHPFANGQTSIALNAVNGVATFTGLAIKKALISTRLNASGAGVGIGASSNFFDVTTGPLSRLGFVTQPPSSVTAGNTLSTFQVSAQDSVGNSISDFSNPITIALTGGTAGATLSGTKTVNPTSGAASFSNLSIDKSGTYQLSASASGVATGTSNNVTVNAGNASQLAWIRQPQNTFLNAPLSATSDAADAVKIAIQDALGNTVTSNNFTTMRLSVFSGPNGTFKHNGGNVTFVDFTPVSGVYTLPATLNMSTLGTYTMQASTFGVFPTQNSASFDVAAFDVWNELAFTQQPTNATVGVAFAPTVVVAVKDQWGNTVTSGAGATPTITLTSDPQGTVAGQATAVSGVATFTGLAPTSVGTGITLAPSGTNPELFGSASNAFNVTAGETLLSTTATDPWGLTVSGSTVIWAESQGIMTMSTGGGGVTTLVAMATDHYPTGIVTDGTDVFYKEFDNVNHTSAIKRVPLAGGIVTTMVTDVGSNIGHLVLDASNIYFRHTGGAIRRVAKAASGLTADGTTDIGCGATFSSFNEQPFAVDEASGQLFCNGDGNQILRGPSGGGSFTTLVAEQSNSFILSGSTLIWVNGNGEMKTLTNATSSGGATATLGSVGNRLAGRLVTDGTDVYWGQDSEGVWRVKLAGGTMFRLNLDHRVWGIGLDATQVFWARYRDDTGQTEIYRAPK